MSAGSGVRVNRLERGTRPIEIISRREAAIATTLTQYIVVVIELNLLNLTHGIWVELYKLQLSLIVPTKIFANIELLTTQRTVCIYP